MNKRQIAEHGTTFKIMMQAEEGNLDRKLKNLKRELLQKTNLIVTPNSQFSNAEENGICIPTIDSS